MEMSDLVVYCQPRSKEKDRFGKHVQTLDMLSTRPTVARIEGGQGHSLGAILRLVWIQK